MPTKLYDAYASKSYSEVILDVAPLYVNVRVGTPQDAAAAYNSGGAEEVTRQKLKQPVLWHGQPLDDLSDLITTVVKGAQVVSVGLRNKSEQVRLYSTYAAQCNVTDKVDVKGHSVMLAFALTDYKLQGRTLKKLVLSVFSRGKHLPFMTASKFYVLVSRVRNFASLRLLQYDREALVALSKLKHHELLYAWDNGYNEEGRWSDAIAVSALAEIRKQRAAEATEDKRKRQGVAKSIRQKKSKAKKQNKPESQPQQTVQTAILPAPRVVGLKRPSPKTSEPTRPRSERVRQKPRRHGDEVIYQSLNFLRPQHTQTVEYKFIHTHPK
jgi:hypothetical protein